MNSIWNKNLSLFQKRFPALYSMIKEQIESFSPSLLKTEIAKNGELTASLNAIRLHSSYNPGNEAENAVKRWFTEEETKNADTVIFLGAGLGYHLKKLATLFPAKHIIYIEENLQLFLEMLWFTDLESVFAVENCIMAPGVDLDQAYSILKSADPRTTFLFYNQAFTQVSKDYYDALKKAFTTNKNRVQINENTKKKFGKLWIRNGKRNLEKTASLPGVNLYKNTANSLDLPFVLIAAGPSLEKILPFIKQIQERAVTVCVDTALKALINYGIQPDFIVLTDPQYWAYKHIAGISCPKSVLITESSVYPSVFRFDCRKTVLCSSLFPWGKYFESRLGEKGDLGSGGSVASSAFNFCELCGAKTIYTCGLDLSFTKNQTHIKGSTFEQAVFQTCNKTKTGENRTQSVIYSADVSTATSYEDKPVLTDSRMKMFAWWFEQRISELPHVKARSLTKESMKIKGFDYEDLKTFLETFPPAATKKEQFFSCESNESRFTWDKDSFTKEKTIFINKLKSKDPSIEKIIEFTEDSHRLWTNENF